MADAQAHLAEYKAAAAGFVQDVKSGATSKILAESGACPLLHAAVNPKKDEIVAAVVEKSMAAEPCTTNLNFRPFFPSN